MTIASTRTGAFTGSGSTSGSTSRSTSGSISRSRARPDPGPPGRRPPLSAAVLDLLERARCTLEGACRTADSSERYRDAHLGALRAAAAIMAARTTPSGRSRPRSVWQVLPGVAPELAEWAAFFAACSAHRSVIDRGGRIPTREADDLLRQAEMFLEIAQDLLGVPFTIPLPELTAPLLVSTPIPTPIPTRTPPPTPTRTPTPVHTPEDRPA